MINASTRDQEETMVGTSSWQETSNKSIERGNGRRDQAKLSVACAGLGLGLVLGLYVCV